MFQLSGMVGTSSVIETENVIVSFILKIQFSGTDVYVFVVVIFLEYFPINETL